VADNETPAENGRLTDRQVDQFHNLGGNYSVIAREVQESRIEIERLRALVDRLVKGLKHPDHCQASYGPMWNCTCGVRTLINETLACTTESEADRG
jgi:hypothetical protein